MTKESVGIYQRLLVQGMFLPIWALIFWGMGFIDKECKWAGTVGLWFIAFFAVLWWLSVFSLVCVEAYIEWRTSRRGDNK